MTLDITSLNMAAMVPNQPINLWSSLLYWQSSSRLLPMVIQQMIFIGGKNFDLSMLRNVTPPVGLYFLPSKSI